MTTVTPVRTGPARPRAGLRPRSGSRVRRARPRTSVMASCSPGSSAADAKARAPARARSLASPMWRSAGPGAAPISSPRDPLAGTPFSPRRGAARVATASPRSTGSRHGRRGGVPRPARASRCSRAHGRAGPGRWSYLAADPWPSSSAPADGPDPFAGARAMLARMAAPIAPTASPAGAAVRRRARRVPRLRPRARVRTGAIDRPRRPAPAGAPARAP